MRACWSCWSNPPTAPAWKTFCRPPPTPLIAWVSFSFADDLVTVQADYPGKVWIISSMRSRTLIFSVSPRDLNETLADFIQQNGAAGNS